jgi:ABC-type branched-subunit amino acid transport system substrate-binding protein
MSAEDLLGLVGRVLERKYRVDSQVAEGGFGVVYRGYHLGLSAPIAVKVLKRPSNVEAEAWADMVTQFLDEAKTIARLRHPAVVNVMDAGVTPTEGNAEELPWMVMEWLDGETLAADLARRRGRGGRSVGEAYELLHPVVEAVAAAHEAGIVHRDLKPSNIMLTQGKRGLSARVLDFGIAKAMGAETLAPSGHTATEATVRAFSAAYGAPEQLAGTRTGPWTDVHALGLLFTEVLTDRSAYPLEDAAEHYRAVFDTARPTPGKHGIDAGELEGVIARALALKPQDRYSNASEMLAALDDVAPREPAHVTTRRSGTGRSDGVGSKTTVPPPRTGAAPRRRLYAAAGTVAALVAAWVAAGAVYRAGHAATAPTATPVARCTTNAACSKPGEPAICRPEIGCVQLRSQDCEPLADARALESDRVLWFGAMFPRTGPDAMFGKPNVNAVDLARRDFDQIMSGASSTGQLDRARPFGVLVCDDAVDARRAARHLVDDVGVPAVIGFYTSVEAIDLATSLFIPKRVLAIASLNANPLVTTVPHPPGTPRLMWRTTYNTKDAAAALSAFVEGEIEPQLRAPGAGLGTGPLRVALLRPRSAAGAALSDATFKTLRFNGKAALDNGYDFREMTLDAEAPRESPEYQQIAKDLVAFTPHVVIYAANAAIVESLFAPLEEKWPRKAPYRPRYASFALITKEVLDFVGTSVDRRRRFFGVTPASTTASNARLVMHYNEVFPEKITRTINPNSSYDAFYLLAYASYAVPTEERVTGVALSRALAKLVPPGQPIDVGLAGIFDAYTALSQNKTIDLTGATGKLDLDPATGEAPLDHAILCVGADESGKAFDGIESGLSYSTRTKKLTGAMRCP